jgi:hypothetical protein
MKLFIFLATALSLVASCNSLTTESIPSAIPTEQPPSISTENSEELLIATEQAKASIVKTEAAMTLAAQPTFTLVPTLTSTPANFPTLTAIPGSTLVGDSAYFRVSSDVLGSQYKIQDACYFDTQSGWERYEIYTGALAGSGDEYSAQGVAIVRNFRVIEQDGEPTVELADTKKYLTSNKTGPLRLSLSTTCGSDAMLLLTTLDFGWFLDPLNDEFYPYEGIVPLARLEVDEKNQLAEVGSYCWNNGCADGPAISTSSVPLIIKPSSMTRLRLPLEKAPSGLMLSAMLVSPPGTLQYEYLHGDSADWSYEVTGRGQVDLGSLPLQSEQNLEFSLEPGYYVLTVLAIWQDIGDVKYGFLIEVQ